MSISVLDCTLRDGGYCNEWRFGHNNIIKIIKSLIESNVQIIECGYVTSFVEYDREATRYRSLSDVSDLLREIGGHSQTTEYVVMINYGDYDIDILPDKADDILIDGIRLAFHKENIRDALRFAVAIQEKGYKLYLQPMVTLSYTDREFLDLINEANKIKPDAIYIVDSFGTMKRKDLMRLFYIADHSVKSGIMIGFHSHNNMQLAFANAQALVDMHSQHDVVLDCSIYGMGRGAGNLNTELILDYLNDALNTSYNVKPLIKVIDRVLDSFYKTDFWGYSLPNYISASYGVHPNYARYLSDKNTLNIEDMDAILGLIEENKKECFDREYVEGIYTGFLSKNSKLTDNWVDFSNKLKGKTVLLIAPGESSDTESELIEKCADSEDVCLISVNHAYRLRQPEYIFVSNLRRFRELEKKYYDRCIVTSNIPASNAYTQVDYGSLLCDNIYVRDNAGLMAIKLMIICGISRLLLAGFDGYSYDDMKNYADRNLMIVTKRALAAAMNEGITEEIRKYSERITIQFVTRPRHVTL